MADRVNRRVLLIVLDLIRASVVLCLPFATTLWQVYGLIFVLQAASAAFTPTFQATIPDVLPDERDYTRALSLSRLAYDLESLISPTLAAVLLLAGVARADTEAKLTGFDALARLNRNVTLVAKLERKGVK